jgi:hypothetical protein
MSTFVITTTTEGAMNEIATPPEFCERVAQLLDDPLPADWRDPAALAARQNTLATIACIITGDAVLDWAQEAAVACQEDGRRTLDDPGVARVLDEMFALFQGLRTYVGGTQRDDGRGIIVDALEATAGAGVAAFVDGMLDRAIAADVG